MNVRPTESTSLAAATDLFAATSASYEMGPIPFERLLRVETVTSQPSLTRHADDFHPERSASLAERPHDTTDASQLAEYSSDQDANQDSVDSSRQTADTATDNPDRDESNGETDILVEGRRQESSVDDSRPDPAAESLAAVGVQSAQQIVAPDAKVPEDLLVTSEVIGSDARPLDGDAASAVLLIRGELAEGSAHEAQLLLDPPESVNSEDSTSTGSLHPTVDPASSVDGLETATGIGVFPSALVSEPNQAQKEASVAGQRRGAASRARDLASNGGGDEDSSVDQPASHSSRRREPKEARDITAQLPVPAPHAAGPIVPGSEPSQFTQPHGPLETKIAPNIDSPTDLAGSRSAQTDAAPARVVDSAATQSPSPLVNTALVSRLPGHALVRGHHSASSEPGGVHVDAARFLQRVAKAFQAARDQGGEISLRLSPPELGALRVEVSMHEQGLVARVQAETPEARTILLENLPALRDRLAEQGIKLERFDVDLSHQRSSQDQGQQPDQSDARPQPFQPRTPRTTTPAAVLDAGAKVPPLAQIIHDRRLNVIV